MSSFEGRFPVLYGSAYRVAYTLVGDRSEAEDIAQEALARALLRWSQVEGFDEAWVVRVSGNLAVDRLRYLKRRAGTRAADATVPGPDGDRVDLQRALVHLPKRQQEVAVLRYLGGMSEGETAAALGCSVGSVKQHASRALTRLRGLIGGDADVATAG